MEGGPEWLVGLTVVAGHEGWVRVGEGGGGGGKGESGMWVGQRFSVGTESAENGWLVMGAGEGIW